MFWFFVTILLFLVMEKPVSKEICDSSNTAEIKTESVPAESNTTDAEQVCPVEGAATNKVESEETMINKEKGDASQASSDVGKDPKAPSSVVIATAEEYNKNNSLCKWSSQLQNKLQCWLLKKMLLFFFCFFIAPDDVQNYCKMLFEFKTITVKRFR